MRRLLTLGCLATLLTAPPASASLFDVYGVGARAVALGGARTASGYGHESAFYNPANVLTLDGGHVTVVMHGAVPELYVRRLDGGTPIDATLPDPNVWATVGASTPLGSWNGHRLGVGFSLSIPTMHPMKVTSTDPNTPIFMAYGDLANRLVMNACLSYSPAPWIRLGLGTRMSFGLGGTINAALSLSEGRFTYEEVDMEITGSIAPTAGVSIGPFYGLRFGATWRSAISLSYSVPIDVLVEELGHLKVSIEGTSLYTPDQLDLGLSWETSGPYETGVTVEAGLSWARWSQTPSLSARFGFTLDDSVLRADAQRDRGVEVGDLISVQNAPIPVHAIDTLSVRVGAEYRPTEQWAVRAGYQYRPTPLPRPTADGNILDASAHMLSLGGGFAFVDPNGLVAGPFFIDLAAQVTLLADRRVSKQPGLAPGGTWAFGGWLWGAVLELGHAF